MRKRHIIVLLGICAAILLVGVGIWIFNGTRLGLDRPAPHTSSKPASTPKDALTCTESLPISIQIGQKLMAAGYSDQLAGEASVFQQANVGGVIIMDQTPKASLASFHSSQAIPPIIATDQEGGTVQRYTVEGALPGATDMAQAYTPKQAYDQYLKDDKYLKSVGITTNFAPVVDVLSRATNPLPGRMYSSDPNTVTSYATASIKAAQAAGITPVIKHFPGLGSASGNTDDGSATIDPLSVLTGRDLVPYQQLASLKPDVMVSNAIVPDLTDGQPATWSPRAVALLRSEGYQNAVVYSDSLTAQAIPGQLDAATIKAWQAGIDVALIVQRHDQTPELPGDFQAIQTQAANALQTGTLNKTDFATSVLRILQRKGINPCELKV